MFSQQIFLKISLINATVNIKIDCSHFPGCSNNNRYCQKWKNAGYCNPFHPFKAHVEKLCRKSCGKCIQHSPSKQAIFSRFSGFKQILVNLFKVHNKDTRTKSLKSTHAYINKTMNKLYRSSKGLYCWFWTKLYLFDQ